MNITDMKKMGQAELYDIVKCTVEDTPKRADAFEALCQIAVESGFNPEDIGGNPTMMETLDYYVLPHLASL